MAKVTGPLFSIEARGKIADAMVHFPWKGLNVVRGWVKPANKQTADQGDARVIMGGLGRACGVVGDGGVYQVAALACAGSNQTWVSKFVQFCRDTYMGDGTEFTASYDAWQAHGASSFFAARAAEVGLTSFNLAYKGMAHYFAAGHMLYMLAQYACAQYILDNAKFATAPYTKAFATWTNDDIVLMVADLVAA